MNNPKRRPMVQKSLTQEQLQAILYKEREIVIIEPDGGTKRWEKSAFMHRLVDEAKNEHKAMMRAHGLDHKKHVNITEPITYYI